MYIPGISHKLAFRKKEMQKVFRIDSNVTETKHKCFTGRLNTFFHLSVPPMSHETPI